MSSDYAVRPTPKPVLRSSWVQPRAQPIGVLGIMRVLVVIYLVVLLGGCACGVESMYVPTTRSVTTFGGDFLAAPVTPQVDLLLNVHRRTSPNPVPDMQEIYVRAALEVGPGSFVRLAGDMIEVTASKGAERVGVRIDAIEYSRWCSFDKPTQCSTTEESPVKGLRKERPDLYYKYGRFYSFEPTLEFEGAVDTEAQGTHYRLISRDYRRYFLEVSSVFVRDGDEIGVQIPAMSINGVSYTVPPIQFEWTTKEVCRSVTLQ